MALTSLPFSDGFALAWSGDGAMDRDRIDAEHAADPTRPAFAEAYEKAAASLDWSSLVRPGESLTLFHFRPIVGTVFHRILDMPAEENVERLGVAFRVALRRIDNGPPVKLERKVDRSRPGMGEMLTSAAFDELAAYGTDRDGSLVLVLGRMVLQRSGSLSPL